MNFIDVRTLMIGVLATNALCTWVVFSLWRNNRKRFAGTSFWVADFGLQTLAVLFLILRGVIPPWVSVGLVNPLAILGALLGLIGLERFVEKTTRQAYNYILFSAFFLANLYFSWIQPELSLRNLILSLGLLTFFLQCAWLLFHRVPLEMRRMTLDVGIVFGLFSLTSIVRIIFLLVSPSPENDFFKSDLLNTLILMSYQLLLILLAYNLSLMVNRRLLRELQSQEEKFNKAFRSSPYALMLTRLSDGRIIEVNDSFLNITGYQPAEAIGKTTFDLHLWAREEDRLVLVKALSEDGKMLSREFLFQGKSGVLLNGLISAEIIRINQEPFILSSIEDITSRKKDEEALRESEGRYRKVIENANEAILVAQGGIIKFHNPKTVELSGYSVEELSNKSFVEFIHPEDRELVLERYQKRLAGENLPQVYPFRIITKQGETKWVEINSVFMSWKEKPATLNFLSDITERKEMEEQLQKMSLMDDLTGLYNRRGFLTLAQQQLKVAERAKKEMLLFFADVDDMKWINDNLSHLEGDHALMDIALLLKETFRESDVISRIGGDEFAVLTLDTAELNPETLTGRLKNSMEGFNQKGTRPFNLALSIGIARYHPDKPSSIDHLLAEADREMYEQKKNKKIIPVINNGSTQGKTERSLHD